MDEFEEESGESPMATTLSNTYELKKKLSDQLEAFTALKAKFESQQFQNEEEIRLLRSQFEGQLRDSKKKHKKLKLKYQQQLQQEEMMKKKHIDHIREIENRNRQKIADVIQSKENIELQSAQTNQKFLFLSRKLNQMTTENQKLKTLNQEYTQSLIVMKENVKKLMNHLKEKTQSYQSDENEKKILRDEIKGHKALMEESRLESQKYHQECQRYKNRCHELKSAFDDSTRRLQTVQDMLKNQNKMMTVNKNRESEIKLETERLKNEKRVMEEEIRRLKQEINRQECQVLKHQHKMDLIESKLNSEIPGVRKKFKDFQDEIHDLRKKLVSQKSKYLEKMKEKDEDLLSITAKFDNLQHQAGVNEKKLIEKNHKDRRRFDILEEEYKIKNDQLRQTAMASRLLVGGGQGQDQTSFVAQIEETKKQNTKLLLMQEKMIGRIKQLTSENGVLLKKLEKMKKKREIYEQRSQIFTNKMSEEQKRKKEIIGGMKSKVLEFQKKTRGLEEQIEKKEKAIQIHVENLKKHDFLIDRLAAKISSNRLKNKVLQYWKLQCQETQRKKEDEENAKKLIEIVVKKEEMMQTDPEETEGEEDYSSDEKKEGTPKSIQCNIIKIPITEDSPVSKNRDTRRSREKRGRKKVSGVIVVSRYKEQSNSPPKRRRNHMRKKKRREEKIRGWH